MRLIVSCFDLFIDGHQPICFINFCMRQSSIPLGSKISEPLGRIEARRRFEDGLSALQKAATKHRGGITAQKRGWDSIVQAGQDGCELSYKVRGIIAEKWAEVKKMGDGADGAGRGRRHPLRSIDRDRRGGHWPSAP